MIMSWGRGDRQEDTTLAAGARMKAHYNKESGQRWSVELKLWRVGAPVE